MIDYEILQDIITDHELCKTQENELAKVVELLKADRLIELPCAVGDTVWEINDYTEGFKIRPMKVESIEAKRNVHLCLTYSDKSHSFGYGFSLDDFGEILFLTKEEAEAKLRELERE